MRRLENSRMLSGFLLALLFVSGAEDVMADPTPPNFTPPPAIADTQDTLSFFAGQWDIRVTQVDPSTGNKIRGFGSSTAAPSASSSRLIVRERSAIHFENGKEDKAVSDLEYSKEQGAFLLHTVSSGDPEGMDVKAVGQAKARELQFLRRDPKSDSKSRLAVVVTSPNSYTATFYFSAPDGNEQVAAEYEYSRNSP